MLHCIIGAAAGSAVHSDVAVRRIERDGLVALVTDEDPAALAAADRARLERYADVISEIHRRTAVIPVRFGCVLPGDEEVKRLLQRRRERLRRQLDQVGDCLEFGIRLLFPTEATGGAGPDHGGPDTAGNPPDDRSGAADAGPGRAHLRAIRRRVEREQRFAEAARMTRKAIEDGVVGCCREIREELGQVGDRSLLSLYFLVPREHADRFVEGVRQGAPALRVPGLLTGPWPPYNFVGAIDEDLGSLVG